MNKRILKSEDMLLALRHAVQAACVVAALLCAACATKVTSDEGEGEAAGVQKEAVQRDELQANSEAEREEKTAKDEKEEPEEEEVPVAVAESEHKEAPPHENIPEVVVEALDRFERIHNLVSTAQSLLRDVKLEYVFTGQGKKETLRGRPVAFALWSEAHMEWTIAHIEIPRPPIKWKPGGKPLPFIMRTPGIVARHVKGTGAERLMFSFSKNGEPLKVYGRKFPVFDSDLLKKKRWRDVASTATPIVYLPFTEDTLDPSFVTGGKDFLLSTARQAIAELRQAKAPGRAFPGEMMADVVPPEVITTLAVIEQTDDSDFVESGEGAFNEVLSQYGLKKEEAYRYSVSRAAAIGPMQFTNKRGRGTYAMVVKRCPEAKIDPDFERGATNLLNAMKAAICLFDLELAQMPSEIRLAYHDSMKVLGIFPVAAYNGGPKNVGKLYRVMKKMDVKLEELRPSARATTGESGNCPCLWKQVGADVRPVSIPKYNNENRWYIEKYQSILMAFE